MLMKGRYPLCCLFLEITPALVDVNIHPSKREVKFREEQTIRKAVTEAVRQALVLGLGDASDTELLRRVGDGIWVQTVSGLHSGTNPVSGDFSVGIAGRAIRDGELAEPVREATIASTLQRMLMDVVGVSSERVWLPGGTGSASLAIDGVSLSGS